MSEPQSERLPLFPPLRHANPASAITSASVLLGFAGIVLALRGMPSAALTCGVLAIACDILDGPVARKLGVSSPFGAALESLADAISFGLLPGAYALALGGASALGMGLAGLYALASVWRLAHFHEAGLESLDGRPVFRGVPTPYAAALLWLLASLALHLPGPLGQGLLWGFYALAPFALLSSLPFPKGGWHYTAMWLLLPLAVLLAWLH